LFVAFTVANWIWFKGALLSALLFVMGGSYLVAYFPRMMGREWQLDGGNRDTSITVPMVAFGLVFGPSFLAASCGSFYLSFRADGAEATIFQIAGIAGVLSSCLILGASWLGFRVLRSRKVPNGKS
jgi:hypothetical protein